MLSISILLWRQQHNTEPAQCFRLCLFAVQALALGLVFAAGVKLARLGTPLRLVVCKRAVLSGADFLDADNVDTETRSDNR